MLHCDSCSGFNIGRRRVQDVICVVYSATTSLYAWGFRMFLHDALPCMKSLSKQKRKYGNLSADSKTLIFSRATIATIELN